MKRLPAFKLSPWPRPSFYWKFEIEQLAIKANQLTVIDDLLTKSGLSLDEVYPTRGKGRRKAAKASKGSSVAPKYRNPEHPSQTWSGRGRQPLWLAAALKKRSSSIEQFLIKGASVKRIAKKVAKKATRKRVRG